MKRIALIIPCYNESDAIADFWRAFGVFARKTSGIGWEWIFIDDGSTDSTSAEVKKIMAAHKGHAIKLLTFSRNFGKEAALLAGLRACQSDAALPIDVDLQDPLSAIPPMIEKWQGGADIVIAIRSGRIGDGILKRMSATLFYKLMRLISPIPLAEQGGDFRLMDKAVVQHLAQIDERELFMKGLYAWVGFNTQTIRYKRDKRHKGTSKFGFVKLMGLAMDGIVSFTSLPLRIWLYLGLVITVASLAGLFYLANPQYALIGFFGGLNLCALGIMGEYIARILLETKKRPLYIIKEQHGFAKTTTKRKD